MSEIVEKEDQASAEVEAQVDENGRPIAVIMELRAVGVSPAGTLFDRFPIAEEVTERVGFMKRFGLMLFLFVLPTLVAGVYFGFVASDRYVAEAKYLVRMAAGGDSSGLSSLLSSGQGLSRAVDETYAVNEYMESRDVVPHLNKNGELRQILSRPEADLFSRFPNFYTRDSNDNLYKHLKRFVSINVESSTGITTLEVSTFRPEDSVKLATDLLAIGEEFINQLNNRANDDALEFAMQNNAEAMQRVKDVDQRMTEYRNRELVLDPAREAAAAIERLNKMALQISQLEAKVGETAASTPNSPALASQRQQLRALKEEFNRAQGAIVGSDGSLAGKLSRYQALALEKELATRALAASIVNIERARQDAKSRRLYLQNVVSPRLPDYPTQPYRLLWTLIVAAVSFCFYYMVKTFRDTVLEHQA